MKIIPPSATVEWEQTGSQMLEKLERIGRKCYKSEGKAGPGTAEPFVRMLLKNGHLAMVEHVSVTALLVCDRGVTHDLVRHRVASYAQECVAGSTRLTKKLTIQDLYESGRSRVLLKSSGFGRVIPNWTAAVFYKGRAPVVEVTTRLGYTIRATGAHEFQRPDETYTRLEHLCIGDQVMVNGRKSLLTIPDAELRDLYLVRGLAPLEIAECHHAPYRAVLRRLRHLGIFESHRNDKHPEKYQRGHTSDSVVKMRQTIQAGYDAGRTPWNKDLREGDHPGVDRQAEFLRTHHHNNVPGEASSAWGGGVSRGHGQRKMAAVRECQVCGSPGDLHVHHRDENPRNNADENLVKVCTNCHAKLHHGWWVGVVTHPDEIVSIREIGVEDVYDLEMEAPFHNYVADGFIVHNSTRFCNYGNDRFGGEISVTVPHWGQESLIDKPQYPLWERAMRAAESAYMEWIALGGKPDEARVVLPNGLKAEIYVTMNLREWMYVFSLRTAQEAHPGMRLVMKSLRDQFREHLPVFFEEDWFRPGASWRKIVKAILMADSLAEAQRIAREALSLPANGTEDNRP